MPKILLISSQIHKTVSLKQLENCVEIIKKSSYDYDIEILNAGTYEIPYVINAFVQCAKYDAYIALGLVLESNNYHFDYIMSHIKYCFTHFALKNIIVGNGIISAPSLEEIIAKLESTDSCINGFGSAFRAVDALLGIQKKFSPKKTV